MVSNPGKTSSYGVALLASTLAILGNGALWTGPGSRYPLIVFFAAIAVSSWFGGLRAGLTSVLISLLVAVYLWTTAGLRGNRAHPSDAILLVIFVGIGIMITLLFETLRRRTAQAQEAERLAKRSAADLIVSQERALEAERAARAHAEQANRLKDELLAVASHELRSPLSAILGWTDILGHLPATDGRRGRALQAIQRNAEEQVRLLGDLMDVARLSSGTGREEHAPIDIDVMVRTAWEIVEPLAESKGIQPTIDLDPDLVLRPYYGDSSRLRRILTNLLSNAVKFTPPGGGVRTWVSRDGGVLQLEVSDTGYGIPPDFLPYLFEPFRQTESSRQRCDGAGLGLWIVRHLVEAQGGHVHAASDGEDRGSTFTVRLPETSRAGDPQDHSLTVV